MAFPERFLEELNARSDIADVVGSYIAFTKKSGSNCFRSVRAKKTGCLMRTILYDL